MKLMELVFKLAVKREENFKWFEVLSPKLTDLVIIFALK